VLAAEVYPRLRRDEVEFAAHSGAAVR
jgi:hypothetical protein